MSSILNNKLSNNVSSKFLARIISDIANPIIVPPFILFLVGFSEYLSFSQMGKLLAISTFFYSVLPGSFAFLILRTNTYSSADFPERRSRVLLYTISLLSAIVGSLLLIELFQNSFIQTAVIIFLVNLFVSFSINFKWKISVHSLALSTGGLYLFLLGLYTSSVWALLTGLILLSMILPLIMWSRYQLNIHSISELVIGATAGIIVTLTVFMLVH